MIVDKAISYIVNNATSEISTRSTQIEHNSPRRYWKSYVVNTMEDLVAQPHTVVCAFEFTERRIGNVKAIALLAKIKSDTALSPVPRRLWNCKMNGKWLGLCPSTNSLSLE
jgi:hypothetical protein